MKKSLTFYLKTVLVCLGFLVILVSGILVFMEKTTIYLDRIGQIQQSTLRFSGYTSKLWYAIVVAAVVVFAVGYFYHKTVNIVLVFVLAPFSAFAVFIYYVLSTFTISIDFPSTYTVLKDGFKMEVIGALLIFSATIISVLRPKRKEQAYSTKDLLDN